ncbi:MAG: hypothetical protein AMJ90_06980 [candidate division Zixibacteria bacterium SM23_73_2]|nr:MAG: hypothetical protein AMJ90_06980 [candidate division Zixibacteria bacterium SM23_73_2]
MRTKSFSFILIISIFLLFNLAFGSGEEIPWESVNAGGSIYASSTNYKLSGSVGQSVAGAHVGTYNSYAGFWNPWVVTTDVEEEEEEEVMPDKFSLSQNYPNPFNPHTVIEYALPVESHVNIVVYNVLGQKVRVLKDDMERVGFNRVVWDGKDDRGQDVASGVYFYRIKAEDFEKCKKMLLLK